MDDYSPAQDSQAAYAAMPNQGLPENTLTPDMKQRIALMLSKMGTGLAARAAQAPGGVMPAVGVSTMPQLPQVAAGQFIGGGR